MKQGPSPRRSGGTYRGVRPPPQPSPRGGGLADLLVAGSIALDALEGPYGRVDDELGGSDATSNCYTGSNNDANSGTTGTYETGNDLLKSRDNVSGNDTVDGGSNTDTCRIDAGDTVFSCEL